MAKLAEPKMSKTDRLSEHVKALRGNMKLDSWNAYLDEMHVPHDLYPALLTHRAQLMPKGRELTAAECDTLYKIIATLIETNSALREHTANTAGLVKDWMGAFKNLQTVAGQIKMFANLEGRSTEDESEELDA